MILLVAEHHTEYRRGTMKKSMTARLKNSGIEIHIMADSCNGEEKQFAQFVREHGHTPVLHSESGYRAELDEIRELQNQLWEKYSGLSGREHARLNTYAD
jgi:hypothetical protein